MKPIDSTEFLQKLTKIGRIDAGKHDEILARRKDQPDLLISEILQDLDHLDQSAFLSLLCGEFGSDYLPKDLLLQMQVSGETLEHIPSYQAQELAIFPLEYDAEGDRLLVATAYPFNLHVLSELESVLDVGNIQVTFTDEETLAELHQKHYIGEENLFAAPDDGGFDIGAGSEEEAFPGIYGSAVSDFLEQQHALEVSDAAAVTEDEGVRGSLAHLGLVDMLQALGQSRKTCAIFLDSGDWYGNVYLEDGLVIHAKTSNAVGEDAVYEILGREKGHFEITKHQFDGEKTMQQSVEGLLLEGMRRLDEANR